MNNRVPFDLKSTLETSERRLIQFAPVLLKPKHKKIRWNKRIFVIETSFIYKGLT